MAKMPKPEEMIASRASFPEKSWMDVKTEIKAGMYAYPAKVDIMANPGLPSERMIGFMAWPNM